MAATLEELYPVAREAGFLALAAIPYTEFSAWNNAMRSRPGYEEITSLPPLADPRLTLPGARSVVIAALDYSRTPVPPSVRGKVARLYLSHSDPPEFGQHPAARRLNETFARLGWQSSTKVPRREAAVAAGLVVQRRNCLGYLPNGHSFISLFGWAVDAEIEPGRLLCGDAVTGCSIEPLNEFSYPPARTDPCGRCRICIDACPTEALVSPFVLDPRRCVDRNTWREGEWLPRELRSKLGSWIYGCDTCQEVCPRNQRALTSVSASSGQETADFSLARLALVGDEEYRAIWEKLFVYNPNRNDIRRNVMVALGNLGDPALEPVLQEGLGDADPVIRGHAAWSLGRIGTRTARTALEAALTLENDPSVCEEIRLALAATGSPDVSEFWKQEGDDREHINR